MIESVMKYKEREAQKQFASDLSLGTSNVSEKEYAWKILIRAHFERSRELFKGKHPDFDTYASHWLRANGPTWGNFQDPSVFALLQSKYPAPERPQMSGGSSYWGE